MHKTLFTSLLPFAIAATLSGCSGGSSDAPAPPPVVPPAAITLLAGHIGGAGNLDGVGADARFALVFDVSADAAGNVYVADVHNYTIRKISRDGVVTTHAGQAGVSDTVDATGAAARFAHPRALVVDAAGTIYVADHRTIRKITAAGVVTSLAGNALQSGSTDGTGSSALFYEPSSLAVDGAGNVYVADTTTRNIRKITPAGVVTTLAGKAGGDCIIGSRNVMHCVATDGTGAAATFISPGSVSVDANGNVYVRDDSTIRKITASGTVTTFPKLTPFAETVAMASDGSGNLYALNSACEFRKMTTAGTINTLPDPAPVDGSLREIGGGGVTVDSAGNCYHAGYHAVFKVTPARVSSTLAGNASVTGSADGAGAAARFNLVQSTVSSSAVDSAGNIYVADQYNQTIRKITPAGLVSTLAGKAETIGWADGPGAEARFLALKGVAIDASGTLYAADGATVRKISPIGVVTTLAGSAAVQGWRDGVGAAASFNNLEGVAVDRQGNVFVSDANNTVRKITANGTVTTLAGTPPSQDGNHGSADGMGTAAKFSAPSGIAVDSSGNVFVADTQNSTIRKITPAGQVSTLVGTAGQEGSADGSGAAARFRQPNGLAVDAAGNLFVAEPISNTIRMITPAGVVTTVAGKAGSNGVALGLLPASLANPGGLAVGSAGVLYATSANAVLKIQLP